MTIRIAGEQDKHKLDFAARNIYVLPNDEFRVLPSTSKDGEYILDVRTIRVIEPIIRVVVSDDMLTAGVSLYPGINTDKKINYQDVILHLIEKHSVSPGCINNTAIEDAVALLNDGLIVEGVLACEGTPAIRGKDANVEFLFENSSVKPKLLPNGKVDYREFTKFVIVDKDQLIIKRTPPDKGKDGMDITGNVIKAVEGVDKTVEVVEGVYSDLEKTEFRSKYNGHVIVSGNAVTVLPMLQIDGDVDMRVGNLRFEGTIVINGNVHSGFVIDADDIVVDGIVENADLKARNTIIIRRGVKGVAGKGCIKAGGNITVGYCENADISSGGEFTVEKYCFNSNVDAFSVRAVGNNVIISGGSLRVFSEAHVANLGSKNSNKTEVELGYSRNMQNKAEKVKIEINQLTESMGKINDVLSKLDIKDQKVQNNPKVKMLFDSYEAFKRRLPLLEKKYGDLMKKSVCDKPRLSVENIIYPGVEINMLNLSRTIKSEMNRVEFIHDEYTKDIINKPFQSNKA